MTKYDFYIFGFIALIVLSIIMNTINQNASDNILKNFNHSEKKYREELLKNIEILKKDRELIKQDIENLKLDILHHEKTLISNIEKIKLRTNVQIRNLNDSTASALLKDLLPK